MMTIALSFLFRERAPPHLPSLDDRFRAVRHFERLENNRDVVLYSRLCHVERMSNCCVALSLHHKVEHLNLLRSQSGPD